MVTYYSGGQYRAIYSTTVLEYHRFFLKTRGIDGTKVDWDMVNRTHWDDLRENIEDMTFLNMSVIMMLAVNFFVNEAGNLCDGSIQLFRYWT